MDIPEKELLQSIQKQDLVALCRTYQYLTGEMLPEAYHHMVGTKVLPHLTQDDLEWFLCQVHSPIQLYLLSDKAGMVAAKLLARRGFLFGRDYSFHLNSAGQRKLLLTKDASVFLDKRLPVEHQVPLSVTRLNWTNHDRQNHY